MKNEMTKTIRQRIEDYQTIMLFRHIRMDGDCVGATKGLREILRLTYPEKTILIVDDQTSEFLGFLGKDDAQVTNDVYRESLGIVIDTADRSRISNQKYALCLYKEKEILMLLKENEETEIGTEIKASINADNMQVYDKKKGIRLV